MSTREIVASLPAGLRPELEPRLPDFVRPIWFESVEDAIGRATGAEVAWYNGFPAFTPAVESAPGLRWLSTIAAGVERFPLALLQQRGITLTNGSGLNAFVVADYAVMGVLVGAKRFAEVVRAQDRREWLHEAPGNLELDGTRALVLGYGAIGHAVAQRLRAFGVEVTGVRSRAHPDEGVIGPDDWRPRLGEFDWIIVAAPATSSTRSLIDHAEFAAMKPTAWVVNVARGSLIARDALLQTLADRRIGGAFLDVTDPEPLAPDDALWSMPNAVITMHLSGRSENGLARRGASLFLANLERYVAGEPLRNTIDLAVHA